MNKPKRRWSRPKNQPDDPPQKNHTTTQRPPMRWHLIAVFLTISLGLSFAWYFYAQNMNVRTLAFEEIANYPHDISAYTQGLVWVDGYLYESTGKTTQSQFRKIDLKSGEVLSYEKLKDDYFGEGLTFFKGRFYQLTWQNGKWLIYDRNMKPIREAPCDTEGWGLTHDGQYLIVSNGTPNLRYYDPKTLKEVKERRLTVRIGDRRLGQLNELEYIDGSIFANVLGQDFIVQIDPHSGQVVGKLDLSELAPESDTAEVLNGIAFNPTDRTMLVSGKYWGKIYAIRVAERP